MSTFKSVVASPFYGFGWVAGQIKNGYDKAVNATSSAASQVATAATSTAKAAKAKATKAGKAVKGGAKAAKAATVKAGSSAKAKVASFARHAAADARGLGAMLFGMVKVAAVGVVTIATAVLLGVVKTVGLVAHAVGLIALGVAALVVTSFSLVAIAAFCVAFLATLAVVFIVRGIFTALAAVGRFLTGEGGMVIATVLHDLSVFCCFLAAVYACVAVAAVAIPALGIAAANAAAVAVIATWCALLGAGTGIAGLLLEAANRLPEVVVYAPPSRRILPNDVYPGVIGTATA
jgi:hypothetical protein